MKLIIGLGNPGKDYETTRHNIGWQVVDSFAAKHDLGSFKKSADGLTINAIFNDRPIILAKPTTYMNLSGRFVERLAKAYQATTSEILVVYDELDLGFGAVRVRLGGSSAGHKGVDSIIKNLGADFWRLRIGIGKSQTKGSSDYVLSRFKNVEQDHLPAIFNETDAQIIRFINSQLTATTSSLK